MSSGRSTPRAVTIPGRTHPLAGGFRGAGAYRLLRNSYPWRCTDVAPHTRNSCWKPWRRVPPSCFRFHRGTRFSKGDAHQLVHAQLTHRAVRNVSCHLAFQHGTLGNHAVLDISPYGNEQFARHRHNPDAAQAPTAATKPPLIPVRQGARGLVAQPGPGELDHQPARAYYPRA